MRQQYQWNFSYKFFSMRVVYFQFSCGFVKALDSISYLNFSNSLFQQLKNLSNSTVSNFSFAQLIYGSRKWLLASDTAQESIECLDLKSWNLAVVKYANLVAEVREQNLQLFLSDKYPSLDLTAIHRGSPDGYGFTKRNESFTGSLMLGVTAFLWHQSASMTTGRLVSHLYHLWVTRVKNLCSGCRWHLSKFQSKTKSATMTDRKIWHQKEISFKSILLILIAYAT